jgi:hypothetical protein
VGCGCWYSGFLFGLRIGGSRVADADGWRCLCEVRWDEMR